MHAVVLVGGFGTRLRPLTNTIPKPMLPVGHVPLIVRLLRRLERGGVDQATLALGFRPEPFMDAFPEQRCGGVELRYAVEPEPLDTGGAIRFAADHAGIDSTFVVANGDVLTDVDVGELVALHHDRGAEATVHLIAVDDPSAFGVADLADDGRILRFVEKPPAGTAPSHLVNAGTYVFEPSVLELIPPGGRVSVERDTFVRLVERGTVFGVHRQVYWLDAGRPEQYLQANLDLLDGHGQEHSQAVATGAIVAPDAAVERSLVGRDATVGAGARLVGSVVLPGGRIGADASVEDSVVMGAVGDGATLRSVVVGAEGEVPPGAILTAVSVPDPAEHIASDSAEETAEHVDDELAAVPDGPLRRPLVVVGGAGFIGSHLVERLLADGAVVDVVDDLSTGSLAALGEARATARAAGGELHIQTLDACSPEFAELIALRRPTTIYHLALLPGHDAPPREQGRGFTAMLAVLEAARAAGVEKVIVALPATALYGHPSGRDLPLKEGTLQARGVRGVVAKAIVDLLTAYREQFAVEFTALALTSVYGPRQQAGRGVVATAIAAAEAGAPFAVTGDGRQTRDFVYVDDVVDALARAGRRGSGLVVNVGTGVQTSLRELWAHVAPGGPPTAAAPGRADELARFAVSPVRARIHLGWAPWTSLVEGLAVLRA
jgi:NDP-sugar pyrophosphorylase family protein/nucleoside-diphosphate-sugar epimerase